MKNLWLEADYDTIVDALARMVEICAEKPYFDFSGQTYTYQDIDQRSTRMGHVFRALGIRSGQTLVTMLDNNVDAVTAWLALNKICAVSVPINTALRGEFLRHQISDAEASIVICEADYLERIINIAADLPNLKMILYRDKRDHIPPCAIPIASLDEYRGDNDSPHQMRPKPSDLAALIYTSGTTGPSKGCMISGNYIMHLARLKLRFNPAAAQDVVFTPLPLFHLNAIASGIATTTLVGGTIAFAPRFSVSRFWPEVERTGATIASILGSMGTLLAQAADNDAMRRCHGQLHTIRGNPFGPELQQTWRERFGAKRVGSMDYGLSEAAIITGVPGDQPTAPGSSGKRLPEFDVRIFDDQDRELPPGRTGEVVVRPNRAHIMFEGYWKRPADTLGIMRNMWLHTGDIGKFDEDGYFYFVDRKKDYLRRRGENISSFEMEAAFGAHPEVAEVAVHAVPSPAGEDDVKVTAVLKPGSSLSEEALCRWALDKVPYFAVPRYIEFRAELPKNPQGRVLKYLLREDGATPATWDLEASDIIISKR